MLDQVHGGNVTTDEEGGSGGEPTSARGKLAGIDEFRPSASNGILQVAGADARLTHDKLVVVAENQETKGGVVGDELLGKKVNGAVIWIS
jgi:hypothetical protein